MAAATDGYRGAGYDWRPRHSSPDTVSPLYPDRPIRPLPKRRLRARLSPEQAESMTYPSPPVSSPPVFDFPYTHSDKASGVPTRQQRSEREHKCSCGADHSDPESEEEEDERLAAGGATTTSASRPMPPGSTSSADGYESFENTNNKKKRKIPVSGSAGHHGNLTAEMASMGISTHGGHPAQDDGESNVGQYYGSGSSAAPAPGSGTGISGAGRGRYGSRPMARCSGERRPLGASTAGLNAYANGNTSRARANGTNGKASNAQDHGIISAAIANAHAASNASPTAGKENVSLLQQEAAKTTPQKTQFTFTCDSPNQINWPSQNGPYPGGTDPRAPPSAPSAGPPSTSRIPLPSQSSRAVATHATQTSPQMNGTPQPNVAGQQPAPPVIANGQPPPPGGAQQQAPPKKPRRRPSRTYTIAARRRRLQQEYTNYHSPPAREDIWICEFCEYEDIFGEPPLALIRQYEIKDRQERKRMEEKKRLLEKAKMKGRKGKKAAVKGAGKGAAAANNHHNQQHGHVEGDQHYDQGSFDHGTGQEEEYFEDDYDDPTAPPASQDEEHGDGHIPSPAPSEPPDTTPHDHGDPAGVLRDGGAVRDDPDAPPAVADTGA
ncbi:uncharacterized protein K452DRAFT_360748 [Aplosporella prunicola CBS 121167]|uniref:Uncharacterized protein n=1 Tax=Aplosporella prunicola CBS 121167 TaxID=1176127 RepID=A0A6A6B6F8_9PEZI|nr:uncharacterized protein K452DRAFT_360748 [Aplosporella prunicola CBS 121167]KAF2139003.1 hypothetical protein K452DRAFT_360748 [Aplosporella prunicola CBS 121167]